MRPRGLTSMGLPEGPTNAPQNQEANRCVYLACQPRTRMCLLKGCEQPFHPRQASERYCSPRCREQAREWSAWKAQQKYRTTLRGKEKRKTQSRRYRERMRNRKEPSAGEARGSSVFNFFRLFLRPAWLLRKVPAYRPIPAAEILFEAVPACAGACFGAGTTVAKAAQRVKAAP